MSSLLDIVYLTKQTHQPHDSAGQADILITPEMIEAGVAAYYRYSSEVYGVGEMVVRIIEQSLRAGEVRSQLEAHRPKAVLNFDRQVVENFLPLSAKMPPIQLPLQQPCAHESQRGR